MKGELKIVQESEILFYLTQDPSSAQVELLRRARLLALQDAPEVFGREQYLVEKHKPLEFWHSMFALPFHTCAVYASLQEEAVGLAFVFERTKQSAGIGNVWVSSSVRGKKVGTTLIKKAILWARQSEYRRITLWNNVDNYVGASLYKKFGFNLTGNCKPNPHFLGLMCLEMELFL